MDNGKAGFIELRIRFDIKTRDLKVDGPTHDLPFCYFVLERAKDVIRAHHDKLAGGAVEVVAALPKKEG